MSKKIIGFHVSNPFFRDSIEEQGLLAQKGWSYTYNHGENVEPAIFFSLSKEDIFNSTYDDDIYEVDLTDVDLLEDPLNPKHVFTYQRHLSLKRIKLIHRGTGK